MRKLCFASGVLATIIVGGTTIYSHNLARELDSCMGSKVQSDNVVQYASKALAIAERQKTNAVITAFESCRNSFFRISHTLGMPDSTLLKGTPEVRDARFNVEYAAWERQHPDYKQISDATWKLCEDVDRAATAASEKLPVD